MLQLCWFVRLSVLWQVRHNPDAGDMRVCFLVVAVLAMRQFRFAYPFRVVCHQGVARVVFTCRFGTIVSSCKVFNVERDGFDQLRFRANVASFARVHCQGYSCH